MKEIFSYTKSFTVLIAISYILGLMASFYDKEILFSFIIFLLLIVSVLFLNFSFKKIIVLYLLFFLGIIRAENSINLPSVLDEISSKDAQIQGQVISSKTITNEKTKFYLRIDKAVIDNKKYENLNTKILVSIDNPKYNNEILIGNYINLKGKIHYPSPSTNPYQFDYQKYLLNNGVKNILYVDELKLEKDLVFSGNYKDNWYFILKKFEITRNEILEKHSKNIKPPNLEILGGIVFGNETINPDENIKESFKNSGLLHLLAASGLNVALIYGIWWWLAGLIRFPYNLSIYLGALFVVLYTFMTGFPPSILRAGTMLLFVLFGKIIDRNINSLASIFFAGFLILLFSPTMLFDVGFQLSFVVTIGLVVCVPVFIEKFKKIDDKYREKYKNTSRFKKYILFLFSPANLASIVFIPLIAQVFVVPLQIHYFNSFTPFSILANILVIPFIGILSFVGFVSSIFALVPVLNESGVFVFDMFANPLLSLLVKISEIFSSFKNSLIITYGFDIFQIFIFWSMVLLFVLNIKNNFKVKKQVLVLFSCVLILFVSLIKFDNFNKNFEIVMFDVGLADSFLIKTPENKYIMIDTGKKAYKGWSSYDGVLKKYLKNERISNLEKLIITHFDSDHCADAVKIMELLKIKEVIIPQLKQKTKTAKEILEFMEENKIKNNIVKNNNEIYFEKDLKIKTYVADLANENEASIITLINYKDKNILFMGDSGIKAYNEIKNYLPKNIEIIKIGHHGAKNSVNEEMIKNLNIRYALISSVQGDVNHPHNLTINILNENDVKILSTERYGFIKAIFEDDKIKFLYFHKQDKKLKELEFINTNDYEFHKSEFVQKFIEKNITR